MDCTSTKLTYRQTGHFNKIVTDYIDQSADIVPFIAHPPNTKGIRSAIKEREKFPTNRQVLVQKLSEQYKEVSNNEAVQKNLDLLKASTTFTITTAHQNNIFTGPLYFIYKIVHAIRLATQLKDEMPEYDFVPVYYIGSEDADLAELNHIHINGERISWNTKQTGAVGRMKIDAALIKLIDRIEGELGVLPHGKEWAGLLRQYYKIGTDVQTATFHIVHDLFANYGLVVLLPDNKALKQLMVPLFEDELFAHQSSGIVEQTAADLLTKGLKVQAHPREINLFYLENDIRERVEQQGDRFVVNNTSLSFSADEMHKLVKDEPEKFSPNVILRGLYQETVLPNIAFVGGGGEIAYWLQLKKLFHHYHIPFPVLVIRNSFLIVEKKWQEKLEKLSFTIDDTFLPSQELLNRLVIRESNHNTRLNGSLPKVEQVYDLLREQASAIDPTLGNHVEALRKNSVYRLQELEKKMLRAEKRKFEAQQRQIEAIKSALFPANGLQERTENVGYFFARWGRSFIDTIYQYSLALEQQFVVIEEKAS